MTRLLILLIWLAAPLHAELLTAEQRAKMRAADIVILGEIHDNPDHHLGQAALLTQVAPRAVVFEMLSPAQAAIFNSQPRNDLAALARQVDWVGSGWPDFALYAPIFEALGDTPVVGAAAPREEVRTAFRTSAAEAFGTGGAAFGLDIALPQGQLEARKELQFAAHCDAMPLDLMGGMVEAQRFRDARFSQAALVAIASYGAPVVVIAGNGHARRDWGMPALIALADSSTQSYAVGFVESPNPHDDPRFDATIVTDPVVRPDPCAAFK